MAKRGAGKQKRALMKRRELERRVRRDVALRSAQLQAFAFQAVLDPRFKIHYLIPHVTQDLAHASLLGWYTPGLHAAAGPLMAAAAMPADIREPFASQEHVLGHRQSRHIWPHILPIQLDTIRDAEAILPSPFRVYITNEQIVADELDMLLANAAIPFLHVSAVNGDGRVDLGEFTVDHILDYVSATLTAIETDPAWTAFAIQSRLETSAEHRRRDQDHPLSVGGHNVVAPNELALRALGWALRTTEPIARPLENADQDPDRYIRRICGSADAVFEARRSLLRKNVTLTPDYRWVIALPGMYWGHYDRFHKMMEDVGRADNQLLKMWLKNTIQATTYFDRIRIDDDTSAEFVARYAQMSESRARDMRSFTAGVAIIATASLAPVLRLEPRLYQVKGDLKQLAGFVRAPGRQNVPWKQSRLMSRLGAKMRSLIAPSFLERIDRPGDSDTIEGLKLISDLPLELMPSGDTSLSMRFDVSRVPVMPGNAYIANCIAPPVFLEPGNFREVLILRSYREDDPLRTVMEATIADTVSNALTEVTVHFIDVANEDEFVESANAFRGACLIFDGHGAYDTADGSGSLVIGGNNVDLWQFKTRCRMPPVVILSACDMQPIDGSHSSAATGAFSLGARTVLAPSVPVTGEEAAGFVARLLLRIDQFIPAAADDRDVLTWREVVSGMLRMTHVTEIMLTLMRAGQVALAKADFDAIQMAANVAINARSADWFRIFVEEFACRTRLSVDDIRHRIRSYAALTESMKYMQLGAPENVRIVSRRLGNALQRG